MGSLGSYRKGKELDMVSCYSKCATWYSIEAGTIDYRKAWELQGNLINARKDGILDDNIVLFLEHPPVFTLGRRGGGDNLLVTDDFLKEYGFPVIRVERGGNITFHGPGQLVAYPIINLADTSFQVVEYVEALEEVMIRTVNTWGIPAERNQVNRGIWVGKCKMGSIGIAVRRGITFHGLALNVNVDLTPFTWIQPCGLQGVAMTSMKQELKQELPMAEVRKVMAAQFESIFGVRLLSKSLASLQDLLVRPDYRQHENIHRYKETCSHTLA
jgi:lipoate-protein ligase B